MKHSSKLLVAALIVFLALTLTVGKAFAANPSANSGQGKPNIVLVFMDNFGWGEPGFNGGGIIRGAPTPRMDKLAAKVSTPNAVLS